MGISYSYATNMVTLECGSQMVWDEWIRAGKPLRLDDQKEKQEMQEFFFGKPAAPPDLPLFQKWKDEGRCPQCGSLGRIHLSTFICETHGVY